MDILFVAIFCITGGACFGALIMALVAAGHQDTRRASWHTHRPTDEDVLP